MTVSDRLQAVILLTVRLPETAATPLSVKEWNAFYGWLKDKKRDPSSLLKGDPKCLLSDWKDDETRMSQKITLERIESLLNQGAALGFKLEKWYRAGLWTITQSDEEYPERLKGKLGDDAPPVLFGCGSKKKLLGDGGIAVVGSRNADDDDLTFSWDLGRAVAKQGKSVISGAARGIDESAMLGALQSEGTSIGVMANNLLRASTSRKYREHLRFGNLILVSPFSPEAGFNVGNAMSRNKYIYCLSDAAVAVNSAPQKGGTWCGAVQNLKRWKVPLWVKMRKDSEKSGNSELVKEGAESFNDLKDLLPELKGETSDVFYKFFLEWMSKITRDGPLKGEEIAQRSELKKSQMNAWLKRGRSDGKITKLKSPVRYQWHQWQRSLF